MTASAWVVNRDRTKVLLAYHNIYNSWAWLGGHTDGERNLLSVAVREVCGGKRSYSRTCAARMAYIAERRFVTGECRRHFFA